MTEASAAPGGAAAAGPAVACRFKTEFEKAVLISNFESRGWKRTESVDEWNFLWGTVGTIRSLFRSDSGAHLRLSDSQMVNHYPSHLELTRKDLMAKNLKRYRRDLEREGSALADREPATGDCALDFFPQTYTLPSELSVWMEETRRCPHVVWILKPNGRSQGKGIEILHRPAQLKRFASALRSGPGVRDGYVASRYIERPLLIGGRKFDLRLYCLVTSYRPLKAYQYREGFARFCNVKYDARVSELDNVEVHLTNVAIQKQGEDYNEAHGNKWSVKNLTLYLQATRGHARTQRLLEQVQFILIHSLKAVAGVMHNDKHCFEVYGFDLLLDDQLKPWLLEVNASPSLSVTTAHDRTLKTNLIHDVLQVVIPPDFPDTHTSKGSTSWNPALAVGGFDLIYDEALMAACAAATHDEGATGPARMGGRGAAAATAPGLGSAAASSASSGSGGAAARGGGFGPATPAPASGAPIGAASASYSYAGASLPQSSEPRPVAGKWR